MANHNEAIREACSADFQYIWPTFQAIVSAGDTYAFPPDIDKEGAFQLWMTLPRKTFVYQRDGEILGTYYLKSNQLGPGSHVCNCGYMVSPAARGQGLATAMCLHSQEVAKALGYRAMQFNSVVSTNIHAIRLWEKLGFDIVGRLPEAFRHPVKGYVDALVMYKLMVNLG